VAAIDRQRRASSIPEPRPFFAAAAEAMRRKRAIRHGGDQQRVDIQDCQEGVFASPDADDQLLAVSEALDKLTEQHQVEAELVKLRYFVGMTNDEAAEVLGISPRTAKYYWTHARAWLFRQIGGPRKWESVFHAVAPVGKQD
jgi:RNA polymerase sigma factor (sigma-70 family)